MADWTLEYVAALQSVNVVPAGPLTVSVDASTTFVATGLAANGNATPVNATVHWTLSTPGWAVTASGRPDSAMVVAAPGAGPATLAIQDEGTYNGTVVAAWTNVSLDALPTELTAASPSATRGDVGQTIGFTANGTGAAGYPYTAWVDPGLSEASIPLPCQVTEGPGGEAAITCDGNTTYAVAGEAEPTVTLTNGYSQTTWSLPTVSINDAPYLSIAPLPAVGYLDHPIPVILTLAPGTGTPPFGPACLNGTGFGTNCSAGDGPTWSFDLLYRAPGQYSTTATLSDSAGVNVSTTLPVVVASSPSLGAVAPAASVVEAGSSIDLTSPYTGGLLPASFWWNLSAPGGTAATGVLRADGTVSWSYVPILPGPETVTLTVVDSLGSRVASSTTFTVLAGPAAAIDASPWNDSVVAGTPTSWSWFATDPGGQRVTSFAAPLSLDVAGPGGSGLTINTSSLGTTLPASNDSVNVPVGAWLGGYLNLTLTAYRAGVYEIEAVGLSPPLAFAPGDVISLSCGPDLRHVHLFDPDVALPGDRVNHTLWKISDPYGNPVSGGEVVVTESFDGSTWTLDTPIVPGPNDSTAWVNYSAPAPDSGIVTVRTSWGVQLLPTILVPAVGGGAIAELNPLAWGGLGIAGVAGVAVWLVRRRSPGTTASTLASDEELRRYAEGREQLLNRIRAEGPITLDALHLGGGADGPTRSELGEWIASLLTERLIESRLVPGGPLEYTARHDERPRIEFDEKALERRPDVDGTDSRDA